MLNSEVSTIAPLETPLGSLPEKGSEATSKIDDKVLEERWMSIVRQYDSIDWNENYPKTVTKLHIPDPESLIEYRSEQLTHISDIEHELLNYKYIDDVSLLTMIAKANDIKIDAKSSLYKVISQMSKIPEDKLRRLQYPKMLTLTETSQRAANLLLQKGLDIETYALISNLVDLVDKAGNLLIAIGECPYFDPRWFELYRGEEGRYNHANTIYKNENELFTKYNIDIDEEERVSYFKSCGIFVEAGQSDTASIDFTPLNALEPGMINPKLAIVMAYRGVKNFLHALEKQQLGNNDLTRLYGRTNPTMARFASRFGFTILLNGKWLNRDEIKAEKIDLDEKKSCWVMGSITVIEKELEKFEEKGFGEKLVKSFSKP